MLETIREYALERLAERGELEDARNRHLNRYVELAETAEPELTRAGQAVWLERLSEENDNIRAALAWSFESGQVELGLRLAGALVRFWSIRGLMTEGRRWLTEALEASPRASRRPCSRRRTSPPASRRSGRATTRRRSRSSSGASTLAREAGEARLEAQALQQIGWIVMTRGSYEADHAERARELAGQALELAQRDRRQARPVGRAQHPRRGRGRGGRRGGRERALRAEPRAAPRARRQAADRELGAHARARRAHARRLRARGDRCSRRAARSRASSATRGACRSRSRTSAVSRSSAATTPRGREALRATALELAKDRGDKRVAAECLQGLGAVSALLGETARRPRGSSARRDALLEAIGATPTAIEVAIERAVRPAAEGSARRASASRPSGPPAAAEPAGRRRSSSRFARRRAAGPRRRMAC